MSFHIRRETRRAGDDAIIDSIARRRRSCRRIHQRIRVSHPHADKFIECHPIRPIRVPDSGVTIPYQTVHSGRDRGVRGESIGGAYKFTCFLKGQRFAEHQVTNPFRIMKADVLHSCDIRWGSFPGFSVPVLRPLREKLLPQTHIAIPPYNSGNLPCQGSSGKFVSRSNSYRST